MDACASLSFDHSNTFTEALDLMTNTVPVSLENLALIYDHEFSPGLAMTGLVHRELRSSSLDLSFGEQFCGAVSIAHQHSCSIRHQTFGGSP